MDGEAPLIAWLLASKSPSIRYKTLVELLGRSAEDAEVVATQKAIMTEGVVPHIFEQQHPDGQWPFRDKYYTPKYTSTHWSLYVLTELAVDGTDPRFRRGVDHMLDTTAEKMQHQLNTPRYELACLWSNILRYAVHGGRLHDPRTTAIIDYLLRDLHNGFCQCPHNGGIACAWGVIRILHGFAAIPLSERTIAINVAIEQGINFVLDHFSLEQANYPTYEGGKTHPLWFQLNFPLFYQVDILHTLRVLRELNAIDEQGAQPAIAWLKSKRLKNGRWRGRSPYSGRTYSIGNASEWVSLFAAQILA